VITVAELVVGDDPDGWAAAAFTVDGDTTHLGDVRVRLVGRGDADHKRRGIVSWSLRGASIADGAIDGLPTSAAVHDDVPNAAVTHANGTTEIDHIVVATPDWQRTVDAFTAVGFDLRRERTAAPMRQGFFKAGEVILEIVGPVEPADAPGPARFFGLALNVVDLDATKALYGDRLGTPKDAVQEGRRIATLRHRDVGLSTAIAFMSV
jgi:glyoxalase/bleomycin resistance protein/dioxygenase superfamily protein